MINYEQLNQRRIELINKSLTTLLTQKERVERNTIEWLLKNQDKTIQELKKQVNTLYSAFKRVKEKMYKGVDMDNLYYAFDHDVNIFYPCLKSRYDFLKTLE